MSRKGFLMLWSQKTQSWSMLKNTIVAEAERSVIVLAIRPFYGQESKLVQHGDASESNANKQ
eukprot:9684085-Ditylum_brightwellii.AAC.1